VVALGEETRLLGFVLAGAVLLPADTGADVVRAWDAVGDDVGLVLLTPAAAAALGARLTDPASTRLTAVLPA
jgi:hypothetical protein